LSAAATATRESSVDHLNKRNFDRLARFIYDYSGIKMPITKLTMLEGRLRRRLRATGIDSFDAYCSYLFEHDGIEQEAVYLIDVVTTNKTDFFREPRHFDYLRDHALPAIASAGTRNIRVWSAACSTGAEPYTLAMELNEFVGPRGDMNYSILATDLSTEVLEAARRGVFPDEMLEPVPVSLRRKYVLTSRDARARQSRITPALRSSVGFARLNLMDEKYPVGEPMDIIFCRNVLIYFDKPTQAKVVGRLCDRLRPGGYLFLGHSESITGFTLPLRTVANTVFMRT
jgi:chemotaxis protein methyltransferase CheR